MTWKQDAEGNFIVDGNTVTHASDKGDSKCNVFWDKGGVGSEAIGSQYCEFKILSAAPSSCSWFGLTPPQFFKPGYQMKGMYYGGNLSDGGGLLKEQWGPKPKQGDIIGMHSMATETVLTVSYYLNGVLLGDAFTIPAPFPGRLYPTVSLNSRGDSVSIKECAFESRLANNGTVTKDWPEGLWISDKELGNGKHPTLRIEKLELPRDNDGGCSYSVSCKCANRIHTTLVNKDDGTWSSSICMSSRMLAGAWREAENRMNALLSEITNVEQTSEGQLVLHNKSESELFVRYVPEPSEPVTNLGWNKTEN
eukprot:CFRG6296T1